MVARTRLKCTLYVHCSVSCYCTYTFQIPYVCLTKCIPSHFCTLWHILSELDVCLSVHRCICVQKKNQLDVTECFIALIICSTCFGHFYAHHQELETICVLLPPMVCSAWLLVVGGRVQDSRLCVQEEGCCTTRVVQHPSSWTRSLLSCTQPPTTSNQALHTIGGSKTHIVSSSWW